ncbi:autotransporter outer membrane beta-barrel domain-containing protein [Plesiomonas shigelloides]|uniref:autotransporter outer membrane beta-barrel domain-containing protein n=1 Tax=Plesiomonas shigelloides TaxID=703 RepID=UPI0012628BD9|nr:autotransporter outer membrane beta-barrel domain-containing protein [Plesiomonas shigelloides]KAB7693148.1 autotransporter outer membrane beta-barrel domain-containing protein [Plesiomonas shigelloides]
MMKKSLLSCLILSTIPTATNAAFTNNVQSGTTVSGETINGQQVVSGVVNDSIVTTGGKQTINNGGVANSTNVKDKGQIIIQDGGVSNNATVTNEGKLYINSGGVSNGATMSSKGIEYVQNNGVSNDSLVLTDGRQLIYDGGKSYNAVLDGGRQYIYKGGESINATLNAGEMNTGAMFVRGGKSISSTVTGGKQVITEGGESVNDTITGNGYQNVGVDGKALNTTVTNGARQDINTGGYAKDTTVINAIYNIDPSAHGENVSLTNSIGMLYNGGKLTGNVLADKNSNLYLAESAAANVSLTGNSSLHILKSLSIDNLSVSNSDIFFYGGNPDFGSNTPFSTLTINSMSPSNSKIHMRVEGMQGDFLNVNQISTGTNTVYITGSGRESSDGYHLIHASGSKDDSFALNNGSVELGTYSYILDKNNDDWYLRTNGLSSGASAVTAYSSSLSTIFFNEIKNFRYRLGDVNGQLQKNNGVWVRYLNENFKNREKHTNYDVNQNGVEIGADKKIDVKNGKLMYGALFSYSDSTINSKGHSDFRNQVYSHGIGLYLTYLSNTDYYIDFISKVNRFTGKSISTDSSGITSTGDYMNTGFGAAIEAGKKFSFENDYWVEPFIRTEAFITNSKDVYLSNEMKAQLPEGKNIRGGAGINFGRNIIKNKDLEIAPYGTISISHNLKNDQSITFNNKNSISYTSPNNIINYGVGVDVKVKDEVHLYGQANYSKGNKFESPINATIGVRVTF